MHWNEVGTCTVGALSWYSTTELQHHAVSYAGGTRTHDHNPRCPNAVHYKLKKRKTTCPLNFPRDDFPIHQLSCFWHPRWNTQTDCISIVNLPCQVETMQHGIQKSVTDLTEISNCAMIVAKYKFAIILCGVWCYTRALTWLLLADTISIASSYM